MIQLIEAIGDAGTVALSRLADASIRKGVEAAGRTLIEVPHIGCEPVLVGVPAGVQRVRCWPNLGGRLESGSESDIVAWWPSLAEVPDTGTVVPLCGNAKLDVQQRTDFLIDLLKRLEQTRGIVRACEPEAPRTIIYTPGIPVEDVDAFASRYRGTLAFTPPYLGEFPGGVCITVTQQVWARTDAYADDLEDLLYRHAR